VGCARSVYYGVDILFGAVDEWTGTHAMRVVLTLPSLSDPGGAEVVAFQWAHYLAQVGDNVTVYTTHPDEDDVAPAGVSLVKAREGNVAVQTRDLARYLKSQQVDVVVALMPYCNLISIGAARALGTRRPKVVISEHNLACGLRTVSGSYTRQQRLARRTYRYADLLVAVSHPVGAEAIAQYGLSWGQVTVVPNPAFSEKQSRVTNLDGPAADPSHLDLVVPARLVPQKRPLIAVDVAASLAPAFKGGVTLHFFGVGPLEQAVVGRARDSRVDVVMHGWAQDWIAECPAGSVVLLTSIVEGFGNVLVEAAAAGIKSVVSSRCMGAADAVLPGITGELIAGDAPDDYAAAVVACTGGPVGDIEPWLRRFSPESSGRILRDALVRTLRPVEEIGS
jgi:glycosyltransferase involved in cell wall biosynthesis